MEDSEISVDLLERIREYLKRKTGKIYFKHIRKTPDNIQVTCPFHKEGQENKPSATIRITNSDRASPGLFNCFTCGEAMPLDKVIAQILGPLYNENEVETLFNLKTILATSYFIKKPKTDLFKIPDNKYVPESTLRLYRKYHPYLESRGISEETAKIYDIGYDEVNNQITFPLRDIYRKCVGIGRRSIDKKIYRYPNGMIKPVYGIYELGSYVNYLWIVERSF